MTTVGRMSEESQSPNRISDAFRAREYLDEHVRHLVVEGVIGVGKTTLARLLADRLDARLVLERFEDNPFLEKFYSDPERWALHTQLSFLASRFQQQNALAERDLFHSLVVCDYTFEKDRIFAAVTLGGDELRLYDVLYRTMERGAPVPDQVIYLRASVDRLVQNIRKRGRPFEREISPAYLRRLSEAYDDYFLRHTKSTVLVVNMEGLDFVEDPRAVEEVIRQIGSSRYGGTTYVRATRPGLFDE